LLLFGGNFHKFLISQKNFKRKEKRKKPLDVNSLEYLYSQKYRGREED
jgi:hypothetical protein